ncbi:hypothetical protein OPV22_032651 [Ensete ventricosum]|uniref:Uncharacterized protein n=1 Tax=Ensete ventricosum TaxID=4639 RepID=A0AAV8PQ01_ENSVE|nr:hypothetical protein OPV22_032651 [Ensete ventricosum]
MKLSNAQRFAQSFNKLSCPQVSGMQTRPAISTLCRLSLSRPQSSRLFLAFYEAASRGPPLPSSDGDVEAGLTSWSLGDAIIKPWPAGGVRGTEEEHASASQLLWGISFPLASSIEWCSCCS